MATAMANVAAPRITLPANFTPLMRMAHNLARKAPGKDSLRFKRKAAPQDGEFLASLTGFTDFEEVEWLMTSCLAVRTREYAI